MADIPVTTIINRIIDWAQARFQERTSWDGLTIIVISLIALISTSVIKYAAWFGLGYGAWTLWKRDKPLK